jgi:NADPH-dependent ferric siderophore reductase
MNTFSGERRIQRVRYELRWRELEVASVARVGRNFMSVTFRGEALADFASGSFDDHIKFIIDGPDGEPVRRDYTPRSFSAERRELTIEYALHGHGQASTWAANASVGQRVAIGGPRGSMIVPLDYDWHLLVGDAAALPAIHRRVEELPAGARAFVIVQVEHAEDERHFDTAAQLDVRWVRTPAELAKAVRELELPAGEGFAWGGTEAASAREIRAILADEKGLPNASLRISAYWKQGASDFHERLEG